MCTVVCAIAHAHTSTTLHFPFYRKDKTKKRKGEKMKMKDKKFCPLIKGECVNNCVFQDEDNCCSINVMAKELTMLAVNAEDEGINVNASLYEGD